MPPKKMYRRKPAAKSAKKAKMTLRKNVTQNVLSCKRSTLTYDAAGTGNTSLQFNCSTTWSWQNYRFRLADLPNVTEFSNLFTQYKVNALKYTFVPATTGIDGATLAQGVAGQKFITQPRLYTVIDRAGNASVNSELAMLQYSNKKQIRRPMETFSVYIKAPSAQLFSETTSGGSNGSGAQLAAKKWYDVVNNDVIFSGFGIGGVQPVDGQTGIVYQVICTAYLQFRGVR